MKITHFGTLASVVLGMYVGGLTGCLESEEVEATASVTDPFPDDFMWGTATAGFQVEMGCSTPCNDLQSDWYQWVTSPVIQAVKLDDDHFMVNGDPVEDGPAHYELYETDFDLASKELHNNAFRMGIEWSRIFPESVSQINGYENLRKAADPKALQHYHDVLDALAERGMHPLVTVFHYSFPLWMHNGEACYLEIMENQGKCTARGWLDDDVVNQLAKYAEFLAMEYGDKVDWWATLNEPYAVILAGYASPTIDRTNPPGISDLTFGYAKPVIFNMIDAHARIYDAIHKADKSDADNDGKPAWVGLVPNLAPAKPADPDRAQDLEAVEDAHYLYNQLFLNALVKGEMDTDADGVVDEVREDLKGRMDYVGINYYTKVTVSYLGSGIVESIPKLTFVPDTTNLFDYYPRGLYEVVMFVHNDYDLPVVITENGVADTFATTGGDFLIPHLAWLRQAMLDGADVRGYFLWSLMDNYEWNHGYALRFGAYGYDIDTKKRTLKDIGRVYGEVAANGGLSDSLMQRFAHGEMPGQESTEGE